MRPRGTTRAAGGDRRGSQNRQTRIDLTKPLEPEVGLRGGIAAHSALRLLFLMRHLPLAASPRRQREGAKLQCGGSPNVKAS